MGVLERLILDDRQWERISAHIIGDERTWGSSGRDNRMFVEAVLWVVRTGSPWRDLPDAFGSWNSAFRRFSRSAGLVLWGQVDRGTAPFAGSAGGAPKASGIVSLRPCPTMVILST